MPPRRCHRRDLRLYHGTVRFLGAGQRRSIALICALSIVAAACSSAQWDTSDDSGPTEDVEKIYTRDEAGVHESITDHLAEVGPNLNEWAAPPEQAACAADRIVERFGVDRLLELGFEPQIGSLGLLYTRSEETAVMNVLVSCIDFETGLLELLSAYQKLPYDKSLCMSRGIERLGLTRDYAAGLIRGEEPDPFANESRLSFGTVRVMTECLGPEDLLPLAPVEDFPQDQSVGRLADPDAPSEDSADEGSDSSGDDPAEGDAAPEESTETTTP
jgi:hypothetical protein